MLEKAPNHTSAPRYTLDLARFPEVPVNLGFVVDKGVSTAWPGIEWACRVLSTHYLHRQLEVGKDFGVCDHEDRGSNQGQ